MSDQLRQSWARVAELEKQLIALQVEQVQHKLMTAEIASLRDKAVRA